MGQDFGVMDMNRVPQVSGNDFILDEDQANEEWNSVLKPRDTIGSWVMSHVSIEYRKRNRPHSGQTGIHRRGPSSMFLCSVVQWYIFLTGTTLFGARSRV